MHDVLTEAAGWALPYGIRDLTVDAGQVSVGISHGTAVLVVQTILRCQARSAALGICKRRGW